MITKQKLFAGITTILLALTMAQSIPAYAATNTSGGGNFFTGLIQFFAQKFGLDQNQVQSAVTDYRNQHKQQMQQHMQANEKSRLDALVSQGKITSAQEQAIIDERNKLRSEYSPAKNLTADQRKQQYQNMQNEVNSWAQSQGVDPKYVMPGFGFGITGGRGHRGFGHWGNPTTTPTPTP